MRIAIGGIHTECSTYSPVTMNVEDFVVMRGEALLAAPYFTFLKPFDLPVLPLLHARAVPGGRLKRETYEVFKAEFMQRLRDVLPLDGLHLAMHGAMHVDGMDDAEGDWISTARSIVGPDCVVAASYDLHGNVSQTIIDQLDIFAGYRTAPHIDVQETMARAFAMLKTALETGVRPGVAWAKIPVLLPGEKTSTEDEPAKGLYAMLPGIDAKPGILDANLMVGYVWADTPRATACAIMTGTDKASAMREAETMAQAYWNAREAFAFGPVTGSLDAMLDIAAKAETRPVILADSGDNPTGGGVGDRGDVLKALVAHNWQDALIAGITDLPAVDACYGAGQDAVLDLCIGASLDPHGVAVSASAKVVFLAPSQKPEDRQAVVQIGGIKVVIAAKRRPYHNIADFSALGLNPSDVALLVVKSGYLSPELAPIANPNLMALTDGVVNQDIEALASQKRPQPIFPFHKEFSFKAKAVLSARWA